MARVMGPPALLFTPHPHVIARAELLINAMQVNALQYTKEESSGKPDGIPMTLGE